MSDTYKVLKTIVQPGQPEIEVSFSRSQGREVITLTQLRASEIITVDLDSLADLVAALEWCVDYFRPSNVAVHPDQGQFDLGGA